jgi:hypothetical protein
MMREWFYAENGQRYGPFPEDQVRKMIRNGQLTEDTLVWCGESDFAKRGWIRIADTELSSQIPIEGEDLNDVKRTIIMLKILQMYKESFFNPRELCYFLVMMVVLMLLAGVMWLASWLGEHMILVIVLVVLFTATAMILRHRRLKRQQDIEILNADVNKMGGDEASRRAKKYQDK